MSAGKRVGKALAVLAGLVGLLLAGGVGWVALSWPPTYPETPTPEVEASEDAEVIERGEYLFHSVAHCTACHMPTEEWTELAPGEAGTPYGDRVWELGPLGTLRTPNITPDSATGVGAFTDGELARVLKHSVGPEDEPALLMNTAGSMSLEDAEALVSYMRSMEPVERRVERRRDLSLPGRALLLTQLRFLAAPRPEALQAPEHVPEGEASPERGEYLARGPAMCLVCHTQTDPGTGELTGEPFSGGDPVADVLDPEMEFAGPNVTPGGVLGGWTEDGFVERFQSGDRPFAGSPMPWQNYAGLTEDDLRSIFQYLKSLEPSSHDPGPIHRPAGEESASGGEPGG